MNTAANPGAQLIAPRHPIDAARLSTYLRANVDGTERYVLSLAGTTGYRLHPGQSGFPNLFLAGDWTFNVVNAGCVEAAVISGRLAAASICGHPKHIYGVFGASEPA